MPKYVVTVNLYLSAINELAASELADDICARASHHAQLNGYVVDQESIAEVRDA